jgi:hypothetical protein
MADSLAGVVYFLLFFIIQIILPMYNTDTITRRDRILEAVLPIATQTDR